jgi:hypothetical protein
MRRSHFFENRARSFCYGRVCRKSLAMARILLNPKFQMMQCLLRLKKSRLYVEQQSTSQRVTAPTALTAPCAPAAC